MTQKRKRTPLFYLYTLFLFNYIPHTLYRRGKVHHQTIHKLMFISTNREQTTAAGEDDKFVEILHNKIYRKVSNIRGTKSQNLNDSRRVLQLSLPNRLKPGVKSRMKM